MMRRCSLLFVALALAACASGDRTPAVREVRPAAVAPGGLLLLSGSSLDRVATVSLGGRLLTTTTLVNDELLTAIAPMEMAEGTQPLEMTAFNGRRIVTSVNVRAAAPGPTTPPAAAPITAQPAPTPPAATAPPHPAAPPAPAATAAPQRITPPSPPPRTAVPSREKDDDDEDKEDKKKDEENKRGRGRGP